LTSIDKLVIKLPSYLPISLITGTPIIVRIARAKYKSYGIEPSGKYDYVYWRIEHPVDLFISQAEDNLLKKYNQYHKLKNNEDIAENIRQFPIVQSFSLFQKFKFKKQISTRVFIKGFDQVVIGTVWEFGFNEDIDKNIIQFALDSGLGERNSLGFGFMNVII
jgi:CRISPR-associated endoribonuclease Cas6